MKRLWMLPLSALVVVLLMKGAHAQEAYSIGFSGPDMLSAEKFALASGVYDVVITKNGEGPGAQAWSFGCTAAVMGIEDNGSIDAAANIFDVTIAGTDAEPLFQEGNSFQRAELAGGNGAISAGFLGFGDPNAVLPAVASVAKISVSAAVQRGEAKVVLRFRDDVQGGGEPVATRVVELGQSLVPEQVGKDVALKEVEDTYTYGFSGAAALTAPVGELAAGSCRLTIVHSGPSAGATAWSLGVAADGVDITSIALAGDAAALLVAGNSFDRTELTTGDGNEGAVSSVVLDFDGGVSLPNSAVVADVGVEGVIPPGGSTAVLSYVNGLRGAGGAGQPVQNIVTQGNISVRPFLSRRDIALEPELGNFVLGFAPADAIVGREGEVGEAECVLTLSHSGAGDGAQGWSYGVQASGADIVSISIGGTDAEAALDPNGSFERHELAVGAGNEGAVGAVVLCTGCETGGALPANSTSSIARIGVSATIPAGGGSASVAYVGGLSGSGNAVPIRVSQAGQSVIPTLNGKTIQLVPQQDCCDAELNYSFTDGAVSNGEILDPSSSGEGCLGLNTEFLVETAEGATGSQTVWVNGVSNLLGPDGIQGWSVGVKVTGDLSVDGVTTDGAPALDSFDGGFNKTFVALAENNGGMIGGTSAVVLCFGCPNQLPLVGTQSILQVSVSSTSPASSGGDVTGCLQVVDGLIGQGQPVSSVFTIAGKSRPACNKDTIKANVIIRAREVTTFLRGDANDDGGIDIADPVWIINELFRNGPESPCQDAADANDDDGVDLADATYLINYQFLGGPPPPAPFPGCGEGSDDGVGCNSTSNCP